ncbi:MAG: hypothetical protein JWP69_1228 [Flaviaesturariibacter sp.]|nr:hypothetical protein [Flaviaesturariibacter sp.]
MKKTWLLLAAYLFSITGFAQTDNTQNALLWKVSGNGLAKPS